MHERQQMGEQRGSATRKAPSQKQALNMLSDATAADRLAFDNAGSGHTRSARAWPRDAATARFPTSGPVVSALFPSKALLTESEACCRMAAIHWLTFAKLGSLVTSYTNRMPIAPR